MARNKKSDIPQTMEELMKDKESSELIRSIETLRDDTTSEIYGTDQSFKDENLKNLEATRKAISKITNKYTSNTGPGVIEFYTQLALSNVQPNGNIKKPNIGKPGSARYEKSVRELMKQITENPQNSFVSDMFFNEKSRINGYNDYDLLYDFIPQISQSIETYVDSIVSPDDSTKLSFITKLDGFDIGSDNAKSSEYNTEKENIRKLYKKYDIENKAIKIIRRTILHGDCFVMTLKYKKEFEKYLNEGFNPTPDSNTILSEENVIITEAQTNEIINYFVDNQGEKEVKNLGITSKKIKEDLKDILNRNLEIYTVSDIMMDDLLEVQQDYPQENKKNMEEYSLFFNNNGTQFKGKNTTVNVNGTYTKILNPRKLLKINVGQTVFGYMYVDDGFSQEDEKNPSPQKVSSNNVFANSAFTNNGIPSMGAVDVNITDQSSQVAIQDSKTRLITDIFCKNIGVMMNKKFIEKNKEFKDLMYELIKYDYLLKKRLRIVFLSPDEVKHFKIYGDEGYGESILKKIMFTAKMYLSVLTSMLMMKLTRSQDHRAFYIETGLSNDTEEVIQGFVRDIKTKETKLKDLNSIDTIFNSVGSFNDYFIPLVNGKFLPDILATI